MKKTLFIFLLFSSLAQASDTLTQVMLDSSEIPAGWGTPYSNYSVSTRASVFYENYENIYASQLNANIGAKQFQSFSGADKGTVFYLEFPAGTNVGAIESFARNFIWEGAAPSPAHPEKIFSVGSVLVIISFPNEAMANQLEAIIRK